MALGANRISTVFSFGDDLWDDKSHPRLKDSFQTIDFAKNRVEEMLSQISFERSLIFKLPCSEIWANLKKMKEKMLKLMETFERLGLLESYCFIFEEIDFFNYSGFEIKPASSISISQERHTYLKEPRDLIIYKSLRSNMTLTQAIVYDVREVKANVKKVDFSKG